MEETPDLRKWRLPRGRHGLPRELVTRSQRERLLSAVVRVTARRGYETTTVADILDEAGVGRETFYELFADKRDCMLAAHAILVDDLEAKTQAAYGQPGAWTDRVRAALAATLEWFATDPAAARFMLIELGSVGIVSRARFGASFESFVQMLDGNLPEDRPDPDLPQAARLAVSAVIARVYEAVVLDRTADLPSLLPNLTYEVLVPYLGEAAALEQRRRAGG